MNAIKITIGDIRTMVNEVIKRTLSNKMINEYRGGYDYDRPRYDLRKRATRRYSPYPTDDTVWKSRMTPKWFKDNGEKSSFDDEQMNASILEDIEDFKYGMEKILAKVAKLKAWAAKKNVSLSGYATAFKKHVGLGGKIDNTVFSGSEEAKLYVNAKSAATNRYPWDIVDEYGEMSPEERDADIQEYLVPALEKRYRDEYDEYVGDYDKAAARRGEIEGNLAQFMEMFGEANPEEMSYVELLEAKEAIFDFAHKNDVYNKEAGSFFKERGLDWDSLRAAIGQEIKKRYDSVPHFHFCENETSTPEGKANYEKQMRQYKELKARTNAHSLENTARSASYGESIRGYNWSSYELVDDNGELVCTVRFEVDSSD